MKFEDIPWKPHRAAIEMNSLQPEIPLQFQHLYDDFEGSLQARIEFPNHYGVSIVFGKMFYSNGVDTYECAVTKFGSLCYTTWITNDVMGYLTKDELMTVIYEVERLCDATKHKPYLCLILQGIRKLWRYKVVHFFSSLCVFKIPRFPHWLHSDR